MDFLVDNIYTTENGYRVTGGCNEGSVVVGSSFLKIYRYIREPTSEGFLAIIGKEYIRDIKLQVKQIQAYRHSLDELYEGMSGELWLEGEGGEYIQKKDVLGAN